MFGSTFLHLNEKFLKNVYETSNSLVQTMVFNRLEPYEYMPSSVYEWLPYRESRLMNDLKLNS